MYQKFNLVCLHLFTFEIRVKFGEIDFLWLFKKYRTYRVLLTSLLLRCGTLKTVSGYLLAPGTTARLNVVSCYTPLITECSKQHLSSNAI